MDEQITIPAGFRLGAVKAGIKPSGGLDLAVIVADGAASAAGVFTTNRVAAAPVVWDRSIVPSDEIVAVVINAGNANAATGQGGLDDVRRTAEAAAERLGCRAEQVLVASTGIIGHRLPMESLLDGLAVALDTASAKVENLHEVSRAIMTTDTVPKVVCRRAEIGGATVTLLGLAKGAAMIGPNMATMLGFLLTDAHVLPGSLQGLLSTAVEDSFNCISVEGHMSTNDTVLILASATADQPRLTGDDLLAFGTLVKETCVELVRMIPGDGEGSTHRVTIDVEGCLDRAEARKVAEAVANSPLVKTAIHGADPNWGRIVSAAGYAGVPFDEAELSLWLNGTLLYAAGSPVGFDAAAASAGLRADREVSIRLALTRGEASIRVWTCDLTAEYVRLNAEYTT